jgi:hypothetical protein
VPIDDTQYRAQPLGRLRVVVRLESEQVQKTWSTSNRLRKASDPASDSITLVGLTAMFLADDLNQGCHSAPRIA